MTFVPPPPEGLPPPRRDIRVLRRTPLFIAAGISIGVIGIVYYGLTHMDGTGWFGASEPPAATADSDASDILRNAPTGNEARLRAMPVATGPLIHVPAFSATRTGQEPPEPVDDDMTETAIAARKAAWEAYYMALAEARQHQLTARNAAMAADIEPEAATGGIPAISGGGGGGAGGGALDGNPEPRRKRDFFGQNASSPDTDYSPYTTTRPVSPFELKAGDIVTAKLVTGVDSDSPGLIKAIVSKTVTDHATGMHVLIPQGATLVGVYDSTIAYGQTRLVTAWQRIIYPPPCDQSLDLGAMPGSDQTGQGGLADITDNHLGKIFTAAILVSVFGAGVQLSQPPGSALQQYNPIQTAGGAVGQQMAELGQEFARRGLNIPPTERIRQGYPFAILLTRDIAFEQPWRDGVCDETAVTPE